MARRVLGSLIVAALGIAAVTQAHRHADQTVAGAGAGVLALELAAGLGAIAAGAHLALRRSLRTSGALLAASGIALLLRSLPLPETGGALPFTAALVLGAFAPALAGAAAVCHPVAGRIGVLAVTAVAAAIAVFGVLAVAVFDPVASGCFSCPRNLALMHGHAGLREGLLSVGLRVQALLCAVLAVIAAVRWARRPGVVRRATAPVAVGGALVAVTGAASFAYMAATGATARSLWLTQCAELALVAAAVGVQALRARALRGQIAGIVVATLPSPERLRAALAERLGDPGLTIAYPGSHDGPVGADGRPAAAPAPGAATTEVRRGREVVALLHHSAELAPERLAAAARGAGPALEHASLRARLRAELAELSASRTRVVEVADTERQRMERDLHDGAQQRLIALSVALAGSRDGALVRAGEEVRAALDDLRVIAHGIHPASLTEAGVAAAVGELAERSRVPMRLDALPHSRRPPPIEAALYRVVLDGVRCAERAGDGGTVVVAADDDGRVALTLPGVDRAAAAAALVHARDRIEALGGELAVHRERVEASVPCGS